MWTKGTRDKLTSGKPMVWRESKDHCTDFCFCLVNTKLYNKKDKYKMEYPSLPSATRTAFFASGTAELEKSLGWRGSGLHDKTSNLVVPTFYMSHF